MEQTGSRNKSKTAKVLNHLKEYGSITSWEAINKYGATRLSAIIFNLRKSYVINSTKQNFTDRYGDTSSFVKYIYLGERS